MRNLPKSIEFIPISEASAALGVSRQQVHHLLNIGQLQGKAYGSQRLWVVSVASMLALVQARANAAVTRANDFKAKIKALEQILKENNEL